MKKIIFSSILFFCLNLTFAQIKISTGMGIDVVNNTSLKEYINFTFFDPDNEVKSFHKTMSLFGEIDYVLNEKYQIGLEYNHTFFFHSSPARGNYELDYQIYKPSIVGYYVMPGEGYELKFGGGIGFRYVSLDEKILSEENFTSSGIGVLAKFIGNTGLGGDFYAYISGDIRYDYLGEPEKDGSPIRNITTNENVNLNSFFFKVFSIQTHPSF